MEPRSFASAPARPSICRSGPPKNVEDVRCMRVSAGMAGDLRRTGTDQRPVSLAFEPSRLTAENVRGSRMSWVQSTLFRIRLAFIDGRSQRQQSVD
jgi:hypothetical protein